MKTTNRTIVELKQNNPGPIDESQYFYQSYHSGIETIAGRLKLTLKSSTNRTIVELKHNYID